jgi:hypothetical protein
MMFANVSGLKGQTVAPRIQDQMLDPTKTVMTRLYGDVVSAVILRLDLLQNSALHIKYDHGGASLSHLHT